jgi:hypothetical protein
MTPAATPCACRGCATLDRRLGHGRNERPELQRLPATTAAVLREAALLAGRAADRCDANDIEVALDLAARAQDWLLPALDDLRRAHAGGAA